MSRWPNKYVIGLTGNIAVGKSVVRQMLQHLGAYTIDADGLSHQAMAPGAPAYAPTIDLFGKFILDNDGQINRAILGSIVFSFPNALAKLEAIVHPVVIQAINTLVTRARQPVVVVEAIKLFETDLAEMVDEIWVVDASAEAQLSRLMDKRGMPADEARKRIIAQRPQLDKLRRANVIINNDGSVDDTWRQVQAAWARIRRPAPGQPPAPARPGVAASAAETARPGPPRTGQTMFLGASAAAALLDMKVRRGMPGNAELIAAFISKISGIPVNRMDIMLAFGQKSYLLAQDKNDRVLGLMGWQVENLITRADEFYVDPTVPRDIIINALVKAVEEASKELQSEVGFILLPETTPPDTLQSFLRNGYEATTLEQIRIPAWREAVHEVVVGNQRILTKKLRADRVMKPI